MAIPRQGVDTCICALLTTATELGDPVYCGNGHGHRVALYTKEKSKSLWIFAEVTGSQRFSSEVTQSQPNFRRL